jgi:hypothetical protein
LNRWRERLGHVTLADLTAPVIHEARSKMLGRSTRLGKPVGTINRELMPLASLLTTAVRVYRWLDDSPMRGLDRLSEPSGRVRFLHEAERDALLRECKAHNHMLYVVVVVAPFHGRATRRVAGVALARRGHKARANDVPRH